jgi:hypothetical protein
MYPLLKYELARKINRCKHGSIFNFSGQRILLNVYANSIFFHAKCLIQVDCKQNPQPTQGAALRYIGILGWDLGVHIGVYQPQSITPFQKFEP